MSKKRLPQTPLFAIGPFHEIACDGHEKLSSLALRIGEVGLPIYGFKDKYSDNLLMLVTIPNCRTAAAIGHLYLDFIEREMGLCIMVYEYTVFLTCRINSDSFTTNV